MPYVEVAVQREYGPRRKKTSLPQWPRNLEFRGPSWQRARLEECGPLEKRGGRGNRVMSAAWDFASSAAKGVRSVTCVVDGDVLGSSRRRSSGSQRWCVVPDDVAYARHVEQSLTWPKTRKRKMRNSTQSTSDGM